MKNFNSKLKEYFKSVSIYKTNDLASGEVMFAASGVTDGTLLKGVRIYGNKATTHSIVMRSKTGTIRHINGEHNFDIKQLDHYHPKL